MRDSFSINIKKPYKKLWNKWVDQYKIKLEKNILIIEM